MDVTSICAAFGLSAAAGLNAWLPLFAAALLNRLDAVELAQPFDDLTGTGALIALGALTAADFVGDKVPAVDHVLHAAGTVIAPVSGGVLFAGQSGVESDFPTLVAALLGGGTAEAVHAGRSIVRPLSTATTGGLANPVLSLFEDAGSLTLTFFAFAVPVLAFMLVLILAAAIIVGWTRVRSRRAAAVADRAPP